MIDTYKEIILRELQKLEDEINSMDVRLLWKVSGEIKNSAGNLCLHLCGNLQHFIGAVLGKSGYVRNRDAEFSSKDIPKADLLMEINKTKQAVIVSFNQITEDELQKIYPQDFIGKDVDTAYFLVHLISHFDYHLGQINYLRRMILKG